MAISLCLLLTVLTFDFTGDSGLGDACFWDHKAKLFGCSDGNGPRQARPRAFSASQKGTITEMPP